jgi:kinesin family protein 3/17
VETGDFGEFRGGVIRTGKLHLVDLAGSERLPKTGSWGRLKEAANINRSLASLGSVLVALAKATKSKSRVFVPYRDSRLTHLLRDSFGGNTKTVMIANCSPAGCCHQETLNTLRLANTARLVLNLPEANENTTEPALRGFREQVAALRNRGERPTTEGHG